MLLIFLILTYVYSLDICRQLNTYETCIASKTEYCRWFPHQRYCRISHDLMQGCSQNLSLKLCTKQISTHVGKQALCIFDVVCHEITQIDKVKCNQNLNKYGCMNIVNPQQLCKWENLQCQYLSPEEIANLNTNFPSLTLSMSVCPLITGFLVAHSNFLETQDEKSSIDYGLLAQNEDLSQASTIYDEGNLQNNYLNSQGQFIWYVPQKQSQFNLLNLQINDQSRVGCIGLDISDDIMFRTLFNINDQKVIYGVNQIYCQYININPFIDQISIFVNQQCQIITIEEMSSITDLQCENQGRFACQISPKNLNCQVIQPINQYEKSCAQVENQPENSDCKPLIGFATHQQCSKSQKYCFLYYNDSKQGYCDDGCYDQISQNDCLKKSNCYWIEEDLNSFVRCSPLQGCSQMGLSKIYCENLALPCIWSENQCKYGDLRLLSCSQANTKYSCSNVQRQDQLCIWYNNLCINTLTHSIFKNYKQLPEMLPRNRNQCLMQDLGLYRFDLTTKYCIKDPILDTKDLTNINKYFCLSLQISTQWNYEQQNCQLIQPVEQCDSRLNINPRLCSYSQNCIYDQIKQSCIQLNTQISCNTLGITKSLCLSNQNELCQWINNSCQTIKIFDKCIQLVNVSPYACSMIDNETCSYSNGQCTVSIKNKNECQQFMNQIQCQKQQNECYYDLLTCKSINNPDQYQLLNCNGLTKAVCVKNQKQSCIWKDDQCQNYKDQYFDVCDNFVNQKACQSKIHQGKLNVQHFCQYDIAQSKCLQNINPINDCGSTLKINIHRCQSFTQSQCYFYNNQCMQLSADSTYQILQLNTLKCSQVNINVCKLIRTQDQICVILNRGSFNTCIDVSQTQQYSEQFLCANIESELSGNPHICSLATDNCYYDSVSNHCLSQSDTNVIYKCDDIISKALCLKQTKYQCIFINNKCQYYNNSFNSIDCQFRNIYSCESNGNNCFWNSTDNLCQKLLSFCPTSYFQSYKVCQNGRGYCFNGINGCVTDLLYQDFPCNIALSQQLCIRQNHMCLWVNNYCKPYPAHIKYCYQLSTEQECLQIQHLNCVFYNSQCLEDSTQKQFYDYYDFESYQYCFSLQQNVYTTSGHCIQVLGDLQNQQMDTRKAFNMQCDQTISMITCIHQRSSQCTFNKQKCVTSTLSSCIQEEGIYHSPQTCQNLQNCFWYSNKLGEGFCYQNELSCNNIQLQSLCLSDFGLNCKYENNKCQNAVFTDCDQIQNVKVNYQTCLQLQPNCYYNFQTHLCKKITRKTIECLNSNNLYDCAYSYKRNCLIVYNNNQYSSCQEIVTNSYNSNNNLNSCLELTDDYYKFNLKTYQCIKITNDIEIEGCSNINKNACLKLTQKIQCIWYNDICQSFQKEDDLLCNQLNQEVCLIYTMKKCIWFNNECVEYTNQNDLSIQYSQGYCIGTNQLWNTLNKSCFTTSDQLVVIQCDSFGFDKVSCLNQNYIQCYWNQQKCTEIINKVDLACENISNYNCDTAFNCKWNSSAKVCQDNSASNLECSEYTYHSCIENSNKNCLFNTSSNKCQEIQINSIVLQHCHEYLSFQLCKLVQNQICTIYDQLCQEWTPRLFDCIYIYNQYGCMYAPISCQWLNNQCQNISLNNKFLCKDIPKSYNKISCETQSVDDCEFNDSQLQCSTKIVQMADLSNIQVGISIDIDPQLCENDKNYNDCIANYKSKCQWLNNECVQSDLSQCLNQSYLSCLNNNSNCKWRNQRCYDFNNNENIEELPTLVSPSVCSIFISDKSVKYSQTVFSCILSDSENDNCDTIGLNDNACYDIKKYQCQFTNNHCSFYQQDVQYSKCNQYQMVNSKVCSSLLISCKYDQQLNQCITATNKDSCTSNGLSKSACLQIITEPCYWIDDQCNLFVPDENTNQCDNLTPTNSLACQYISYQKQICTYDQISHVCTTNYNRFQQCNEPGLNKYACFGLMLQPCQFVNYQCSSYTSTTSQCYGIENVNSLACAIQVTQKCNYHKEIFGCYGIPLKIPCNSSGINRLGCSLQTDCKWDYDTLSCLYSKSPNINMCYSLTKDSCISNSNCLYENNNCRLKRCIDLSDVECLSVGTLNNESCYLDAFNNCQIAKQCEDIIYLNEKQRCDTFFFNSSACFQINNNCLTATAIEKICPQTDCSSTFCIKDNNLCRAIQCSDHDQKSCPKNNCAYINDQCVQITTCSDIQELEACNLSLINNQQCSWQPSALRVGPYHCTNKPCYLFGSSWQFCQGNEMNDQACFVTKYAQCESCEEQTDQATCLESKLCTYTNNQCKSILCKHFTNQQLCEASKRCYWSSTDKVCRKKCEKHVEQEQCDIVDYECIWNEFKYICETGTERDPDLSYNMTESDGSSNIIKSMLIICLIYF